MRAVWIETDETETPVVPNAGFNDRAEESYGFTLEELQGFVRDKDDCMVEHIGFPDGSEMYLNEEGKNLELGVNFKATALWEKHFGKTDIVVGNVLFIDPN